MLSLAREDPGLVRGADGKYGPREGKEGAGPPCLGGVRRHLLPRGPERALGGGAPSLLANLDVVCLFLLGGD
jgi:hypothetical protein